MPAWFKKHNYTTIGTGKIFHPGVCSGLAVGEDPQAWTHYFHAPGPDGKTHSSCANGAYTNGTCDSGKTRTISLVSNASLANGPSGTAQTDGTPDGQVAMFAIKKLHELGTHRQLQRRAQPRDEALDRPFFLAVGLHKPHLPHVAPAHFFDLYDEASVSLPPSPNTTAGLPALAWFACVEAYTYPDWKAEAARANWSQRQPLDDAACRRHRRAYFASLSYTDAMLGAVLAALQRSGLANETVVGLWADHGWALGDNNEWGKHTAYYRTNHVPVLFVPPLAPAPHAPPAREGLEGPPARHGSGGSGSGGGTGGTGGGGGAKAKAVDEFVDLVDVFPTIAELAGIPAPPVCADQAAADSMPACVEGRSLAYLVAHGGGGGGGGGGSAAFWQWSKMMIEKQPVMGYAIATELRGHPFRYTEWVGYDFKAFVANFSDLRATELYNLTADAQEGENIAATRAGNAGVRAAVAELSQQLREGWRGKLRARSKRID
jgi:iduronate 2-sulfatase